ncbi:TetR family transcriptional regulator [Gorillibacterium sp. CAU 1737]|uniref:TetR/AcrR family transcriptional regulator n=1 Tax=Gorillibacterium sp. CAU 1737 TaxID=3140362 RepID=UPI00326098ED
MAKRAMTSEAKAAKSKSILDKSTEMFMVLDYDKIKMSDIAKNLGISNGILFVYFRTKEELFFRILCREYEKRLTHLIEMAKTTPVRDYEDFKNLVMNELMELIDQNPLYIKLESMRTAVFEKNVDAETMLHQKINLYKRMSELVGIICKSSIISPEDVMEILQTEASIITGCKLSATLPEAVIHIIEQNDLNGLKRNFEEDVRKTMIWYLDGYPINHMVNRTAGQRPQFD